MLQWYDHFYLKFLEVVHLGSEDLVYAEDVRNHPLCLPPTDVGGTPSTSPSGSIPRHLPWTPNPSHYKGFTGVY